MYIKKLIVYKIPFYKFKKKSFNRRSYSSILSGVRNISDSDKVFPHYNKTTVGTSGEFECNV